MHILFPAIGHESFVSVKPVSPINDTMRKFICFMMLLSGNHLRAQYLVVNGDFEQENTCTEYRVNCAPEGWISTSNGFSNYIKDGKSAYNGYHYMAIDAGSISYPVRRSYLCSQLLCRLRKGSIYKIQLHLKSRHPLLDSVGIYFTSYDFIFETAVPYKLSAAVYVADARQRIKVGDTSWQQVTLEYKATGLESYITIGSFYKSRVPSSTGIPLENHFYIFVDGVSFTPLDPNEKICKDWLRAKEEIYARNERHEFLQRAARYYNSRNMKPQEPLLSLTTLPKIDTVILPDIFFATAKSNLRQVSYQLLDSLSTKLKGRNIDSMVIEGNTDNRGTVAMNETLSEARAAEVKRYLQSKLMLADSVVVTRGNASNKNIASNATEAGRQRNRRVDIYLYLRE
jgi:outer membrane protein OmpA-like peptidoglycan-associated protein